MRDERDRFARLTREDIAKIPGHIRLQGRAKFVAPDRLQLEDGRFVQARSIVIATGSSPLVPAEYAVLGDRLLTNESVFELHDLPAKLAVIVLRTQVGYT